VPEHRSQPTPPSATGDAEPAGEPTGPAFASPEDAVVRRTRDGWRVGGEEVPDLTCAMVLADLLAADMPADGQAPAAPAPPAADEAAAAADGSSSPKPAGQSAPSRSPTAAPGVSAAESSQTPTPATSGPETANAVASEARRLKATVSQLQYALTARIRVEQAIGVLAERHRIQPRLAFEQLRAAARSRGQKVIDIATDVVASATNPLLQLPDELSRPRSGGRRSARQPRGAS
jgi:hypothetical protein